MLFVKINILYLAFLNIIIVIQTLKEVPVVEDNNIATSEAAIRSTVNNLFSILKIEDVKHRPRFKHFFTIHNFFVSITLTDYENLKEIARLSRVHNINNSSQHFITQVNEVLNEGDKSKETNDNDVYVTDYIDKFIKKLKYLKETYVSKMNVDINSVILKYIDDGYKHSVLLNTTEVVKKNNESNEDVLSDNEYWRPSGRRIYHGYRTRIKKFPFVASVQFFKKFQCAGSIIKSDLVITSASCLQLAWNNRFFRENPAFLSVQIGSDYYEGGGDNIGVLEIYFQPHYNPKTLQHNLAVMRLTRKIRFRINHSRVKKIELDQNPWQLPSNTEKITVIGWGAKDSDNIVHNPFRNKLSYAELSFYPLADCQDHYSREFVSKTNFCAGFFSKGAGACNRDAGGPGIVDGTLMGVISFGSPVCGAPDAPTVFTKLGYYHQWIENIMAQDVPHARQPTTKKIPVTFPKIGVKKTTTQKTLIPIMPRKATTARTTTTKAVDSLRIAQDQGFKDFLSTMFASEEIVEYFDTSSSETMEEVNKTEKEGKITYTLNDRATRMDMSDNLELESSMAPEQTTQATTDEVKLSSPLTEPENSVTDTEMVTTVGIDEKSLEKDIMTLIDNLDIKQLIKLDKSTINLNHSNNVEEADDKQRDVAIEASDKPRESNTQLYPNESVLNLLFLSEENKDKVAEDDEEGGLSIQTEAFNDLTFRETRNQTNKQHVFSEKSLYDLISLAINEEAKRINKKKHYIL